MSTTISGLVLEWALGRENFHLVLDGETLIRMMLNMLMAAPVEALSPAVP